MKKSILNLGTILGKADQKQINGGRVINCYKNPICPPINEIACIVIGNNCKYLA